jgi:hypothetical protein
MKPTTTTTNVSLILCLLSSVVLSASTSSLDKEKTHHPIDQIQFINESGRIDHGSHITPDDVLVCAVLPKHAVQEIIAEQTEKENRMAHSAVDKLKDLVKKRTESTHDFVKDKAVDKVAPDGHHITPDVNVITPPADVNIVTPPSTDHASPQVDHHDKPVLTTVPLPTADGHHVPDASKDQADHKKVDLVDNTTVPPVDKVPVDSTIVPPVDKAPVDSTIVPPVDKVPVDSTIVPPVDKVPVDSSISHKAPVDSTISPPLDKITPPLTDSSSIAHSEDKVTTPPVVNTSDHQVDTNTSPSADTSTNDHAVVGSTTIPPDDHAPPRPVDTSAVITKPNDHDTLSDHQDVTTTDKASSTAINDHDKAKPVSAVDSIIPPAEMVSSSNATGDAPTPSTKSSFQDVAKRVNILRNFSKKAATINPSNDG